MTDLLLSDLWLADSSCRTGCEEVTTFDATGSSTFTNLTRSFSITYGSGAAAGVLGQDIIQMAGFSVSSQTFGMRRTRVHDSAGANARFSAAVDQVSDGLLTSPISGLMGLAFQTIAASGATPFWQNLVESGAWDSPVMSFQLTRYVLKAPDGVVIRRSHLFRSYVDQPRAQSLEPGGTFTMGKFRTGLNLFSVFLVSAL